jgi:phospholipase C
MGAITAGFVTHATPAESGLAGVTDSRVIYSENRSLDHLCGFVTGASGIPNVTPARDVQVDRDG